MAERLALEVRRARILDTAMEYIAEEGYRGLTMRALARRCGMSAPGLMHHFPDLPTLLIAVLDHRDARFRALINADEAEVAGDPLEVSMQDDVARVVDTMAKDPQSARLFAMVQAESLDPRHPAHRYFLERTDRIVAESVERIGRDVPGADGLARRIIAVLDGLQLSWLRDVEGFDIRAHWAAISPGLFAEATATE